MKSLLPGIKDPNDKQRAIRDLEYLLLSPAEKEKLREDRTNRQQTAPFFIPRSVNRGIFIIRTGLHL